MQQYLRPAALLVLLACGPPDRDPASDSTAVAVAVRPIGADTAAARVSASRSDLATQAEPLKTVPVVPPPPAPRLEVAPEAPTGVTSSIYPNRPANFTRVVSDYAMSALPPGGWNDRSIGDGSGWGIVGNPTRVSDSSDPVSPPYVMQWTYPAGHGTPTSSFSAGKIYRAVPNVNEIYIAFPVWHDANFEWNAVSNKLMFLMGNNGANWSLTFQSRHNAGYWNLELQANNTATDYDPNTGNGGTNPTGRWVKVEVLYKLGAGGHYKLFVDGALVSNFTNTNFPTGPSEIMLDGTWGGGSGPSTRTSTRRIGHILIAHP